MSRRNGTLLAAELHSGFDQLKRFCFVHVPKCGGTTFRSIVLGRTAAKNVLPAANNLDLMQLQAEQIANYPVAMGHFDHGILSVLPQDTLRFTVLRDPVERYISTVSHMMRDPGFSHLHSKVRDLPFDEALLHADVMTEMRNSMVKLFCHERIPVGLAREAASAAAELRSQEVLADLQLARDHLETYDVVGTQEQYFDSVQLMFLAADVPPIKIAPILNEDRSERQTSASAAAIERVREALDLDQQLYEYAAARLRRALSSAIYDLAIRQYASKLPRLPERFKFDLNDLPGAYGWYEPELDPRGARLWGGSRDEQGFVLNVEPNTRYVIIAQVGKREPSKEMRVVCSVGCAETLTTNLGVVLRFQTGPSDFIADVSFIYPGATSPLESGTGTDERKLGLVLFELGIFRVNTFEDVDVQALFDALHASAPGQLSV